MSQIDPRWLPTLSGAGPAGVPLSPAWLAILSAGDPASPPPTFTRLPDPARARVVAASPAIDPYQAKAKRL